MRIQVSEKAGLTFPAALRSILRQDPDVILVGEVRDKETAMIAVQASLTGHMVLTTLHTIDAASSVTRLVDIGIESYKIAAAESRESVRSGCCAASTRTAARTADQAFPAFKGASQEVVSRMADDLPSGGMRGVLEHRVPRTTSRLCEVPHFRAPRSSATSRRTTRRGRSRGGRPRGRHMRGLWESGVQHVRNGITSIEELQRVIEAPLEQEQKQAPARPAQSSRSSSATESPAGNGSAPPPAPRAGAAIDAEILPPPEKGRVQTRHSKAPSMFTGASFQLVDEENVNANGHSRKVLLVEDEDALRRVLKDLLEREGFTVFEAADGVKAHDEIDRAAPDIVVLDLNLPRLDGYGVLSHLRARPATADLPVIVLTAKGDEDSEVRVFEYGASDYLTKPFRPRALSARLHSLLTRTKE